MNKKLFQWAVVGAGPAGIAAIGKLLDNGIPPQAILWLDPHFNVGDFGRYWHNVSSNTKAQLFVDFLQAATSFNYDKAPDFELNHLPQDKTCTLKYMAEPLQWVTHHLLDTVHIERTCINHIVLNNRIWSLQSHDADEGHQAKNIILATGATSSNLLYPEMNVIPFELAIDKTRLTNYVSQDKTYAVFGSSHSAIMIIKHLVDLGVKKVINFYRSPCRYAVDMGDWILFDNTGLKGDTAEWARQHIDGVWPSNLERHASNDMNIAHYLSTCDHVIYAVGFQQRNTIAMGDYEHLHYNPHVGIIGPGLFGLGIAYPEKKQDPFGSTETQVGLWKFMTYLTKVLPIWLKYHT